MSEPDKSCLRGLLASAQYRDEDAVTLPDHIESGEEFVTWVRDGMPETKSSFVTNTNTPENGSMNTKSFNYLLRHPSSKGKDFMELVQGENCIELPASHFNSVSQLMREAFVDSKCQSELEGLMNGTIKPDPLLDDGRFLECLTETLGWGREGRLSSRGGMEFADGYEEDILVHPEFPEYILIRSAIDPGEEYTNFYLGKRDPQGCVSLIHDTGTSDLFSASATANAKIEKGHIDPIPLPNIGDEPVHITLAGGISAQLSVEDPEVSPLLVWTCDILTDKGTPYTSFELIDPFKILDFATDENTLRRMIKRQKSQDDLDKMIDVTTNPF